MTQTMHDTTPLPRQPPLRIAAVRGVRRVVDSTDGVNRALATKTGGVNVAISLREMQLRLAERDGYFRGSYAALRRETPRAASSSCHAWNISTAQS